MNRITEQNIVNKILSDAKAETTKFSEKEEITLREMTALSNKLCKEYVGELQLRPFRPNMEEAADEICRLFLDGLKDWDKEKLRFALSALAAGIAAQQLRDAEMI